MTLITLQRYSLASSSTTDPNTGCNPSPAPDTPEQSTSSPTLPPPLPPLSSNGLGTNYIGAFSSGHNNGMADNQHSGEGVTLRPILSSRGLAGRPPSPSSTDYELADDALVGDAAQFSHVVPRDTDFSGEPQSVSNLSSLMVRMPIICGRGNLRNKLLR